MSTAANESESSTQTSYWEPPYSHPTIMTEDLLVINIFAPGTVSLKNHILARKGLLDTKDLNRSVEPRKKRFPFLYPSKPNSDPIST